MSEKRIKLEKDQIDHDLRMAMEEVARDIARKMSAALGDGKVGFCLFMFEMGEGGVASYVANINRQDMNKALREFLVQSERGGDEEMLGPRH